MAQGGMEGIAWAQPEIAQKKGRQSPWEVLDQRLREAGVAAQQVQVAWIKQARAQPAALGEFPQHADVLKDNLVTALWKLKQRFPNLRIAYLSSRIYAGYANTPLNPEPYAYESAFAVRGLIADQIEGKTNLNFDPARGKIRAPLLLWGPYLWANGTKGRKIDDLVWKREDSGTRRHPPEPARSAQGRDALADVLQDRPDGQELVSQAGTRVRGFSGTDD